MQVLDMLEVCRDFLQTAEQLAKNDETVAKAKAKKEQKEANQKIIDTLGNVGGQLTTNKRKNRRISSFLN